MPYKDIGKKLQIEGDVVHDQYTNTMISREEGIARFNEEAEKEGLKPLFDPVGYMALDGNVHAALAKTYDEKYNAIASDIEDGFSMGSVQAMDAILDKLPSVIRKDSKKFLPEDLNYGDLRFVRNTPEIQANIDKMVDKRIEMTLKYSMSRSIDDASFKKTYLQFSEACNQFADSVSAQVNSVALTVDIQEGMVL